MKEYVGIYIKTEKAQEQDGFGNKMTTVLSDSKNLLRFLQQNVFNTIKTTSIYLNRAFKFQHKLIVYVYLVLIIIE